MSEPIAVIVLAAGQGRRFRQAAKPLFVSARVVEVPVEDPGVLWEVDVPEALVFG